MILGKKSKENIYVALVDTAIEGAYDINWEKGCLGQ